MQKDEHQLAVCPSLLSGALRECRARPSVADDHDTNLLRFMQHALTWCLNKPQCRYGGVRPASGSGPPQAHIT